MSDTKIVKGSAAAELEAYRGYLMVERRLAPLTVTTRTGVVRRFLCWRVAAGALNLSGLSAEDVHRFMLGEAGRLRGGSIRPVADAVRSFLHYLFATGITSVDLAGTLPPVSARRTAALPRAIDADTIALLVASCDRATGVGLRDFAILTVMLRLGLRANEVAGMRPDDVDWRAGDLVIHGKGGRRDRMPLPADVGDALVAYLRRGRPASTDRAVFLRALPPAAALSRNGVVMVPRTASRRAGIADIGAHRLRHTAATGMLQAGASWREVGQVLRHQRSQTTAIYASADTELMGLVVRAWPGAGR